MVRSIVFKILFLPVSLLYGLGVSVRNLLYGIGVLDRITFSIPVVSVGNLTIGGAGKTPHIEYLIRLLRDYLDIATLSRGYRRKTKGFLEVLPHLNAQLTGDEPLQFKRKYPNIFVSVSESRTFGIPQILSIRPQTQVILLDDAFQHLAVKPGMNILLTEYDRPYNKDFLLPSGRLREWPAAANRADIIIVSKCPPNLTRQEADDFGRKLRVKPGQPLFFSYYEYQLPYFIFDGRRKITLEKDVDILLVCAIAGTTYLVQHLETEVNTIKLMEYEDHHPYTGFDLANIKKHYEAMPSENKIILTTEKDAVRFQIHQSYIISEKLPIYALPVKVAFHFDHDRQFDEAIKSFLLDFKA